MLFSLILLGVLTKAEIIERFNAAPVTQLSGLVQVYGYCPPDMRREYQLPVASFASGICRKLYESEKMQPLRFREPGIIIHLGDVREKLTNVVAGIDRRDDGSAITRVRIPSPSGADIERLRLEIVKAFYLAVRNETIGDDEAIRRMRASDPETKAADIAADIAAWREGRYREGLGDEDYLKMLRVIHTPGRASAADALVFASRLYLYPAEYSLPFCGRYSSLSFREAVEHAADDPEIRLAAYRKLSEIALFGGGRGAKMASASMAYQNFLAELVRYNQPKEKLLAMLDDADEKLKGITE